MFWNFYLLLDFSKLLLWNYNGQKSQLQRGHCSLKVPSYLLKLDRCNVDLKMETSWFFIKHARPKVFMKFPRLLFSTAKLKSPIKIVLSFRQVNWPNAFDRWSRKYFLFWEGGLYNPVQNHSRFFNVKSSKITSVSLKMDSKVRTLLGICSLM